MKLLLVNPRLVAGAQEANLATVRALLAPFRGSVGPNDLVLLPEHHYFGAWEAYLEDMRELAAWLGSTLIAGSMHRQVGDSHLNTGAVLSADGTLVTLYEKLRPYAKEREHVSPGSARGGSRSLGGASP